MISATDYFYRAALKKIRMELLEMNVCERARTKITAYEAAQRMAGRMFYAVSDYDDVLLNDYDMPDDDSGSSCCKGGNE